MKTLLSLLLIFTAASFSQQRILVSPNGDLIQLTNKQAASDLIRAVTAHQSYSTECTDKATFGYSAYDYGPPYVDHINGHQNIVGMWYVAPATGTIDSVFWWSWEVGSIEGIVTLRLAKSNIYPGHGPGYDGYPKPGKLCWGYYPNTNDLDNGLASFPEDATGPWQSTVVGSTPSFPPIGDEIWGFGGTPVSAVPYSVNGYGLGILGSPTVTAGDPFFITIKVYGPHVEEADDDTTGFFGTEELDSMATHNWKFYEHTVQMQPGFTCPGWVARGDFHVFFWYAMTVTSNLAPTIHEVSNLRTTLETTPRPVQAVIADCNLEFPASAGVKQVWLRFSINDLPAEDLPMACIGADTWEGLVPGCKPYDKVSYKIVASDSSGLADSSRAFSYRVVGLSTEWYAADTGAACDERDISLNGTAVDNDAFFLPPDTSSETTPMDDGTAGPIDMGATYTLFADTFRYAWIGVNGGLALGKSPLDTLDVNADGYYYSGSLWDIPNEQKSGRADSERSAAMPGMFIAPFWADLIVEDDEGVYGRILYGNDDDPCLFIVQWDSIGSFDTAGVIDDITTFRAVLDRCRGTVEFQYKSVGTTGLDTMALVGMQADSNEASGPEPGWIHVARLGHPPEVKPRDNWCVRLYPKLCAVALDGWNLVAVSLTPPDGDFSRMCVFPEACSPAFEYAAGYAPADPLEMGKGFWVKFDCARMGSAGTFEPDVTAVLHDKWNLIGGPSGPVPVASIVVTGTTLSSPYYGYGPAGYYDADTILPGRGYWVKATGPGTLALSSESAITDRPESATAVTKDARFRNVLTIADGAGHSQKLYVSETPSPAPEFDRFELPPPPPAGVFDARFSSGMAVAWYPAEDRSPSVFPILIQGAASPLTLRWSIGSPPADGRTFTLAGAREAAPAWTALTGSGSMTMRQLPAHGLRLSVSSTGGTPSDWALSPNYPNPFNRSTRMTVDVPEASEINIGVFDLLGRRITTLLSGALEAGSYPVEWSGLDSGGKELPSGVYIVRMTSPAFSSAVKVMLLK